MKKLLTGLVVAVVGLSSVGQAAMIDDAVSWLYTNGYTIFSNTRDYQPNNYMRRDEAAKFFVKVAEGLGKTDYVKSASECTFSDLNDGHADLKDIVVKSCRLGIFQGHEGKFMPTRALTNAQALAVMIRIVSGYESESGVNYWADNYYVKAQSLGWLSALPVLNNKEGLATRGTVAQLVYMTISDGDLGIKGPLYYEYNHPDHKFSLQFPTSWEGYIVKSSGGNYYTIRFGFGTSLEMDELFYIGIVDLETRRGWQADESFGVGSNIRYLGEKNGHVYYMNHGQDAPDYLIEKTKDIDSIIKTFKLY